MSKSCALQTTQRLAGEQHGSAPHTRLRLIGHGWRELMILSRHKHVEAEQLNQLCHRRCFTTRHWRDEEARLGGRCHLTGAQHGYVNDGQRMFVVFTHIKNWKNKSKQCHKHELVFTVFVEFLFCHSHYNFHAICSICQSNQCCTRRFSIQQLLFFLKHLFAFFKK